MTFALGVDLGTSHTVAMLRRPDGRTRPLLFDGQPLLPSAVFRDSAGRLHVGRDALRLGYAEPDRFEPNPKRHVDAESVLLGGVAVPVPDLFAALLGAVAREAVAAVGFLPPAVVTYPAAWGSPRQGVLVAAIARAGWPPATALVPEPVAAARYFAEVLRRPVPVGSSLAVFDFGAGTLDIAVVRNDGDGRLAVAASGGLDDLGGLDLDAALVDHLATSLSTAEPDAWAALTDPMSLAQWRARRQFWDDVRGAKEMLSRAASAPVPVPGVEHAVRLARDELEAAVDPLLRRGVAEAAVVIKAAGSSPAELAGLFLVGGSSRVPMVARLLHAELGVAPTVLEQPELPVAEGATLAGSPPGTDEPAATEAAGTRSAGTSTGTTVPEQAQPAHDQPVPYEPRLTAAAAPVPTPTTAPYDPSAPAAGLLSSGAPTSPEPEYAEPVDPWASAEAEAIAEAKVGYPGSPAPQPWPTSTQSAAGAPHPGLRARAYRKWVWISAFGVAVVLLIAVVVIFRPGYRAIDFQPLADPVRIAPVVPVSTGFSDAEVIGDRAYFAGADTDGALGVVAAGLGDGHRLWASRDAGVAERWRSMVALPHAVAVFTDADLNTRKRRMIVLGADDGKKRWERTIGDDDRVYFAGTVAVLVDRTEKRLLGLKVDDGGRTAWEVPDLGTGSGTSTAIIPATTPDDVSGPAGVDGRAFAPKLDDDTRIVQLSADRSARVIDASTGKVVVKPRQSVAEPNDEAIAHNGRLIVHESANNRIVSYELGKLGEPNVLYTAADTNRQLEHLVPCGKDRICFVETSGYDRKTAQVVSVDAAKGGHWSRAVPQADGLLPIGDSVLATRDTTPDSVSLLDPNGKTLWTRAGTSGRLDAGNLLLFSKSLSTSPDDVALTGEHLGDTVVPLGALSDVRSATCGWDKAVLACVGDKDFVLVTFAG
jgi:molecular chaperone HscA